MRAEPRKELPMLLVPANRRKEAFRERDLRKPRKLAARFVYYKAARFGFVCRTRFRLQAYERLGAKPLRYDTRRDRKRGCPAASDIHDREARRVADGGEKHRVDKVGDVKEVTRYLFAPHRKRLSPQACPDARGNEHAEILRGAVHDRRAQNYGRERRARRAAQVFSRAPLRDAVRSERARPR